MAKKKILLIVGISVPLILLVKFLMDAFLPIRVETEPFPVRVLLVEDSKEFAVEAKDGLNAVYAEPPTAGNAEKSIFMHGQVFVAPSETGIKLGDSDINAERVRFIPVGQETITLNKIPYRGEIQVIKTRRYISAINIVDLEDYLKGVLPCEVNYLWPFEALKAQAIASRSFAAYQTRHGKSKDYDLRADVFSQVYGGVSKEKSRTTRAVLNTAGKVLIFKGKVIEAYFHSCCGGHTKNAGELWDEDLAPFKGVECRWCRISPHFRWSRHISGSALRDRFVKRGYDVTKIYGIRAAGRDKSGRVKEVRVKYQKGWIVLPVERFCDVVGRNTIRSSNFRIHRFFGFYFFSGYGWGHGAGMCQWGAFGAALGWKNAGDILAHYYPGTKIEKI